MIHHHRHHNIFHVFIVLTKQTAENTTKKLISEQSAFPFIIVWVWQWGAWKHAPM